ncbi:hypothetical protein WS75_01040 [Burkholderia sp. FL-7-2-10-S1-D7]|nr:hypothetical protein WS75_01040 [Burkholderia sp. FL-7-2-10-S1-D7]
MNRRRDDATDRIVDTVPIIGFSKIFFETELRGRETGAALVEDGVAGALVDVGVDGSGRTTRAVAQCVRESAVGTQHLRKFRVNAVIG